MAKNKMLYNVAEWLLIIGGLNWGLALFDVNLVTMLFSFWQPLVMIVYGLVGLSALMLAYMKLAMGK